MKIALYIEDGLEQVVLTPDSAAERNILEKLYEDGRELTLKRGSFFECQGGWVRHAGATASVMIVLRTRVEPPKPSVTPTDALTTGAGA